jgi:hypothetical protein
MILNLLISTFVLTVLLIYGHKLSKRGTDDLLAIQSAHQHATVRFGGVSTSGIKSILLLNSEIIKACKKNGVYTNLFFLILKIPFKILEVFRRPSNLKK